MLPSTILQKRQLIAETVYRNVSPHGSNEFDSRQLKPCVPPADAVERPATRLSHATRALLSAALLSSAMSIVNCAGADAGKLSFIRSEEHTSELQSLRHLVCRL